MSTLTDGRETAAPPPSDLPPPPAPPARRSWAGRLFLGPIDDPMGPTL